MCLLFSGVPGVGVSRSQLGIMGKDFTEDKLSVLVSPSPSEAMAQKSLWSVVHLKKQGMLCQS